MFFTFMSDTACDESDWNSVFRLETHVHGTLREYFDDYAGRTEADVFKRLIRLIQWAYKKEGLVFTDAERDTLQREMPQIMAFLAAHKEDSERENGMFWACTLRAEVIRECARRSPAFLQYLQQTGEMQG